MEVNLYIYTYSIEHLEKLKSNNGDEFASLNRTYKGEENVSIQSIRITLTSGT